MARITRLAALAGAAVLAAGSAAIAQEVRSAVKYGDMSNVTQDMLNRAAATRATTC